MNTSDAGLAFIAREEGFVAHVYRDFAGVRTIGYGHALRDGDGFDDASTLTEGEALELLRADVASAEAAVRRLVKVPLTQAQFDALVSFTFNLGSGALASSTLLRKLNRGDYGSVPAEMARWCKYRKDGKLLVSPTLERRRAAEGRMFAGDAA